MLWVFYGAVGIAILMVGLMALGTIGHDVDMDHDHDHDVDDEVEGFSILSLLGIGKAPLSILAISYTLTFGIAGIVFQMVSHSWLAGWEMWALGFAIVFSLVSTSIFARIVHMLIPSTESYAKKPTDLLGRVGVVVTRVTATDGSVDARDAGGTLHRLRAVVESGEIVAGEKIAVLRFDDERRVYFVEQLPD